MKPRRTIAKNPVAMASSIRYNTKIVSRKLSTPLAEKMHRTKSFVSTSSSYTDTSTHTLIPSVDLPTETKPDTKAGALIQSDADILALSLATGKVTKTQISALLLQEEEMPTSRTLAIFNIPESMIDWEAINTQRRKVLHNLEQIYHTDKAKLYGLDVESSVRLYTNLQKANDLLKQACEKKSFTAITSPTDANPIVTAANEAVADSKPITEESDKLINEYKGKLYSTPPTISAAETAQDIAKLEDSSSDLVHTAPVTATPIDTAEVEVVYDKKFVNVISTTDLRAVYPIASPEAETSGRFEDKPTGELVAESEELFMLLANARVLTQENDAATGIAVSPILHESNTNLPVIEDENDGTDDLGTERSRSVSTAGTLDASDVTVDDDTSPPPHDVINLIAPVTETFATLEEPIATISGPSSTLITSPIAIVATGPQVNSTEAEDSVTLRTTEELVAESKELFMLLANARVLPQENDAEAEIAVSPILHESSNTGSPAMDDAVAAFDANEDDADDDDADRSQSRASTAGTPDASDVTVDDTSTQDAANSPAAAITETHTPPVTFVATTPNKAILTTPIATAAQKSAPAVQEVAAKREATLFATNGNSEQPKTVLQLVGESLINETNPNRYKQKSLLQLHVQLRKVNEDGAKSELAYYDGTEANSTAEKFMTAVFNRAEKLCQSNSQSKQEKGEAIHTYLRNLKIAIGNNKANINAAEKLSDKDLMAGYKAIYNLVALKGHKNYKTTQVFKDIALPESVKESMADLSAKLAEHRNGNNSICRSIRLLFGMHSTSVKEMRSLINSSAQCHAAP